MSSKLTIIISVFLIIKFKTNINLFLILISKSKTNKGLKNI